MEENNILYEEKIACLFLLQQALKDNDKEKAFILAMKIEEINDKLKINEDFKYKSK